MKKMLPFKTIKKNRFGGHAAWFIFNSEIHLRTTREISRTTLWEPLLYRIDSILFGTQSSSLCAQHFVYRVSWSSDGCIRLTERRHCSPSSSRTPLVPVKAKMSVGQSEMEPLPFRVPRDYPHSRFSKAPLAVYPPKGARAKAWWVMPPPLQCFLWQTLDYGLK